jgi:predicted nucleic acid-binding protein
LKSRYPSEKRGERFWGRLALNLRIRRVSDDVYKGKGRPTKPYDLQIGAHARSVGATLITNDPDDFRHMPGLAIDNWLQA